LNWINTVVRPKIQGIWRKRETPENLWITCPETGEMVFHSDLEANLYVVPGSGYHMKMPADQRLKALFDEGAYTPLDLPEVAQDPLKFRDERRYSDRLKDARAKTGRRDAIVAGFGPLRGMTVTAAVQDFAFMGGSLGMAAGEGIVTALEAARERQTPFVMFAASGGARMQEGILSLMQMPRTTVAVERLKEAGLPYIVVLTHPTTGGVTASYAMLGDVQIAEPGALIGFAGPRVIEQTIRETLPDGFQKSEYLLEHGMVDMVVKRHDLRDTLAKLCHTFMHVPLPVSVPDEDAEAPAEESVAEEAQAAAESADGAADTSAANAAMDVVEEQTAAGEGGDDAPTPTHAEGGTPKPATS